MDDDFISVSDAAKAWHVSEKMVTTYLSDDRISGAKKIDNKWQIPKNAVKPARKNEKTETLLEILRRENAGNLSGGIYHLVQIELTYNSNHIEGSKLSHDQTRYIFETNTILPEKGLKSTNIDDVVETANHFRCVDYIIENANRDITENMLKTLHQILKNGTTDSRKDWFAIGEYKKYPNTIGNFKTTTPPEKVSEKIQNLLSKYSKKENITLDDLLDFHYQFESIHPFQDGNGRVGRLILFKECLKHNIVPFIIDEDLKAFYYRGLDKWKEEKGYLRDTCLTAQDKFKTYLDYFNIKY